MKIYRILPFAILLFFGVGCSFINKFGSQTETNKNTSVNISVNTASTDNSATPVAEATPESKSDLSDQKNLLAFASGTTFAKMPPEYYDSGAGNWTALALIDDYSQYGWAKRIEGGKVAETMVLEMGERNMLKTLSFDTKDTDEKASAKNIVVEISDTSANDGFQEVLATELGDRIKG